MTDRKLRTLCIDVLARTVTVRSLTWDECKSFVGGWLEPVALGAAHHLLVDEEGLLKAPQAPPFALGGRTFVGNAVVLGLAGNDYGDATLEPWQVQQHLRFPS